MQQLLFKEVIENIIVNIDNKGNYKIKYWNH